MPHNAWSVTASAAKGSKTSKGPRGRNVHLYPPHLELDGDVGRRGGPYHLEALFALLRVLHLDSIGRRPWQFVSEELDGDRVWCRCLSPNPDSMPEAKAPVQPMCKRKCLEYPALTTNGRAGISVSFSSSPLLLLLILPSLAHLPKGTKPGGY
ncbi:hypothetical protein NM208_g9872 [Fusarium decemcellulare]|uniref:Uncharacterized protein n=1 Tax=Fusarium decemcellulare TaxID=57161 RepID=A0ACC1S0H3_9HYPO|nr:hypothetical protein NM208_g9872 [Fusarium decemcellulare]